MGNSLPYTVQTGLRIAALWEALACSFKARIMWIFPFCMLEPF